eukprot:TRINITY_DN9941_c3_g1_i1.p1 TRINITY_DN9941_c3_g1~~TRINITY_DN9941_c3_g1_i1.p1  ORF type:complete len:510 (+),score=146.13 TRINITY_DN9941_c3_g1_i1:88-1530(+)
MAASIDSSQPPHVEEDEHHDEIWASMTAVTIQQAELPRPDASKAQVVEEDSPASSETGSSTSEEEVEAFWEVNAPQDLKEVNPDAEDGFGNFVTLGDLLHAGNVDDAVDEELPLPSVQGAQQQLEQILTRRDRIRDIASRYSGSKSVLSKDPPTTMLKLSASSLESATILPSFAEDQSHDRSTETANCSSGDAIDNASSKSRAAAYLASAPPIDDLELDVDDADAETFHDLALEAKIDDKSNTNKDNEVLRVSEEVSVSALSSSGEDTTAAAPRVKFGPELPPELLAAETSKQSKPNLVFGPSARPGKAQVNLALHRLRWGLNRATENAAESSSPHDEKDTSTNLTAPLTLKDQHLPQQTTAAKPTVAIDCQSDEKKANDSNPTKPSPVMATGLKALEAMNSSSEDASRNSLAGSGQKQKTTQQNAAQQIEQKVDQEKLNAGKAEEGTRYQELWEKFLAGNDAPVGGDFLPPPDAFHRKP